MKCNPWLSLAFLALVATSLTACSKDKCATPSGEGLVGTWKLVNRQCYCLPTPTPNETVTFTATNFAFFANGQPRYNGTYTSATVSVCGLSASAPGLRFSSNQPSIGTPEVQYTITGTQLVLDYGGPCDAPRDTYERVR